MTSRIISLPRRFASSLLTAVAVAVTAHLAMIFAYSVSQGFAQNALGLAHDAYLAGSLFTFIFVFLAAAAGAFSRWYWVALLAIVVGFVAPLLGLLPRLLATGSTEILVPLLATLSGLALAPFVFTVLAIYFVGRVVWAWSVQAPATFRGEKPLVALVRLPSPRLAEGEITHIERTEVDAALADEQWDNYVTALADNGFTTIDVDPAPDAPDSVFIEDAVVIFGDTAVLGSPGADSRATEIAGAEDAVRALGLHIERIEMPGTLDGGDVLKVGTTVYVGRGGRTNAEGIRQLRAIVTPLGYTVVAVPVTKVLHLKSAVTALPDGTVIGYLPLVDDTSVFDRFLAVPEAHGTAVVVLAPDAVLMSSAAPQSAELIRELGYRVVTVDISEFEKMEGCVTCLSVRVR
jgi:dimethylargininase